MDARSALCYLARMRRCTDRATAATASSILRQLRSERDLAARLLRVARALIGHPYVAGALIGGPDRPERLVVDLAGFDCVTYVENVLALARASSVRGYVQQLIALRYHCGRIEWRRRNHYFYDWLQRNAAAGFFHLDTPGPGSRTVSARLAIIGGLPPRQVSFPAVGVRDLLRAAPRIADGSVAAFVSTRPRVLDFCHTGLLFWEPAAPGPRERLLLYHATRSLGGVVAEPLGHFFRRVQTRGLVFARALPRRGDPP
ncbi:MAG: DUF1460 domain-containing protein [Deltaproteobacteria bacterium]|nr:DUF1460 domain-containing protein [Deltaproteobacteria bacterium]